MHLSKTVFVSAKQRRNRPQWIDCEKPFAEGVATADTLSFYGRPITAKGDATYE